MGTEKGFSQGLSPLAILDTISLSHETAVRWLQATRPPLTKRAQTTLSEPTAGRQTLHFQSNMDSVAEIESIAEKMAAHAGFDEDTTFHITMAVREAAVNAVLHGNEYDPGRQVTVGFEDTGSDLVFTIADQGKGVDPESLPDPLAEENLLRGTGRGIFLIRSFMDEVHFRQLHPGTELTLVKRLSPPAAKT